MQSKLVHVSPNMKTGKLKGKWGVDFKCEYHGRRRRHSPENSKRGAEAYADFLRQRMTRGEDPCGQIKLKEEDTPQKILFADFAQEWFDSYVVTNNKLSEQYTKKGMLRVHLIPWFGKTPIDAINAQQIEQFKAAKKKANLNPKTINNFLACLQKCLQTAVDWDKLAAIPKIKKFPIGVGRIDFLSPIESAKLLTDKEDPLIVGMALMGLRTGMRFGEIIGLDWRDVDMRKRVINVCRNKVMGAIGTPKNGKTRSINIASDLYAFLEKQTERVGPVFKVESGRELTHHFALNALKRACIRVGIRKTSWHVLRHTTASHLVTRGIPITVVKELLGHSSILMTSKYAHLAPSAIKDAVELFSQIEKEEAEKNGAEMALSETHLANTGSA